MPVFRSRSDVTFRFERAIGAAMPDSPAASPFFRIGPERPVSPVVLSIPHAGRDYRPELLRAARLPQAALETLEDRLVDRLVWAATPDGATAFGPPAPRAGRRPDPARRAIRSR